MYTAKKHGIVVLQSLEIKNSNAVFTFTMDDNTQDTFISGDKGMLALDIDDSYIKGAKYETRELNNG